MNIATDGFSMPTRFAARVPTAKTLVALMGAMLALASPSPATAWDSDYHTGMTQLTRNMFQIPGIKGSDQVLVWSGNAKNLCYTERYKMPAKDRVWLELVCGSNDPDHDRNKLGNILQGDFWFHNGEAEQRANYEFNKAVIAYRDSKQGNAVAANHLGRSIHYLQDLLDFSKHFDGDADAKRIRSYSETLAKNYMEIARNHGGKPTYPKALLGGLREVSREFGSPPATPKEFLKDSLQGRKELAALFKQVMSEATNRDRARDQFIEKMAMATIVAQEQLVSIYLRYIGVAETPIK